MVSPPNQNNLRILKRISRSTVWRIPMAVERNEAGDLYNASPIQYNIDFLTFTQLPHRTIRYDTAYGNRHSLTHSLTRLSHKKNEQARNKICGPRIHQCSEPKPPPTLNSNIITYPPRPTHPSILLAKLQTPKHLSTQMLALPPHRFSVFTSLLLPLYISFPDSLAVHGTVHTCSSHTYNTCLGIHTHTHTHTGHVTCPLTSLSRPYRHKKTHIAPTYTTIQDIYKPTQTHKRNPNKETQNGRIITRC